MGHGPSLPWKRAQFSWKTSLQIAIIWGRICVVPLKKKAHVREEHFWLKESGTLSWKPWHLSWAEKGQVGIVKAALEERSSEQRLHSSMESRGCLRSKEKASSVEAVKVIKWDSQYRKAVCPWRSLELNGHSEQG